MTRPAMQNEIQRSVGKNIKSSSPKVSVIIPAYNVAAYIAATLDSALAQTFSDLEIIVINDGSPDSPELEKILAPYFDDIVYLKQPNKGAAAARNAGIEAARGEILAFLDGDDIWLPDYLQQQVKFLAVSGNDMAYCDAELFGEVKGRETYMERSPSHGRVTTESLLLGSCNAITSGTVVLREKVEACGGFDETAPPRIEDFDLWFRLLKNGAKIGYQKQVLLKYRVRPEGLSGSLIARIERTLTVLDEIKRKHELTAAEETAWQKQFDDSTNLLQVEKGKASLMKEDFGRARTYFTEANKGMKALKLSLVILLLKVSPKAAKWMFQNFRRDEARALGKELVKNEK